MSIYLSQLTMFFPCNLQLRSDLKWSLGNNLRNARTKRRRRQPGSALPTELLNSREHNKCWGNETLAYHNRDATHFWKQTRAIDSTASKLYKF